MGNQCCWCGECIGWAINVEQTSSFGYWVRRRRKALDLTQASLANQVGCATVTIKKIERDERRPSRTMAERLADSLQIPEDERQAFILGGLGEVPIHVMPVASKPVYLDQAAEDLVDKRHVEGVTKPRETSQGFVESSSPVHNLPPQVTPFIGREVELAELDVLCSNPEERLITIVGPGGIGKTRLAVAYGERVVERMKNLTLQEIQRSQSFVDGVFFVDMTPLSGVNQIVLAIAKALNIRFHGGTGLSKTPRQQLITYLSDKRMLFIMDNFEQLLVGVDLVVEILQGSPGIQILTTSRERLKLRQEQLYPVPALQYGKWETPEQAAEFTAVKIFMQAAHRIRTDFVLTGDDLADLERICDLVGGLPLALELAAGWVNLLPLYEIAAEIENSISFLATELRDVPDRHRSTRAVFETTWEQLKSEEQALAQKLSVFRGGFTRQAASYVMAGEDRPQISLRILASLVGKSVIQVNQEQDRYQIHELLRQYANERLAASAGLDTTRTAHSRYYTEFVSRLEADLKGMKQTSAVEKIEAEFANIRAAWGWALRQGDQSAIDSSLNGLIIFSHVRGRHLDGIDLILNAEAQLASTSEPEDEKIMRRLVMSRINLDHDVWSCDITEKLDATNRILMAAQRDGDQAEVAFVLMNLAWLQTDLDLAVSLKYLESSREIYRQLEDRFYQTNVMYLITFVLLSRGQYEEGGNNAEQTLKLARITRNPLSLAWALFDMGFVSEISGRYVEAESYYREAGSIFGEMNIRHWGSENLAHIGWLAFLKGEFENASPLITEGLLQARKYNLALAMHKAQGMLGMLQNLEEQYDLAAENCQELAGFISYWSFGGLLGMAYANFGLGDYPAARSNLLKSIDVARSIKALGWQTQCLPAAALLAAEDGQTEWATSILALAFHHPASATGWMQEFPLIIKLRSSLEYELTPPVFKASWEWGKRLDLEEAVTSIIVKIQSEPS